MSHSLKALLEIEFDRKKKRKGPLGKESRKVDGHSAFFVVRREDGKTSRPVVCLQRKMNREGL